MVNASNLGGFDSTDLRDVWIYLDRGTNNFAGNEVYFDYLSIGGIPDSALNSPCFTDTTSGGGGDTTMAIQYTLHWATGGFGILLSSPWFTCFSPVRSS